MSDDELDAFVGRKLRLVAMGARALATEITWYRVGTFARSIGTAVACFETWTRAVRETMVVTASALVKLRAERDALRSIHDATNQVLHALATCEHPPRHRYAEFPGDNLWCEQCGAIGLRLSASNEIRWRPPALALITGGP